jgi:hypothetical protein
MLARLAFIATLVYAKTRSTRTRHGLWEKLPTTLLVHSLQTCTKRSMPTQTDLNAIAFRETHTLYIVQPLVYTTQLGEPMLVTADRQLEGFLYLPLCLSFEE